MGSIVLQSQEQDSLSLFACLIYFLTAKRRVGVSVLSNSTSWGSLTLSMQLSPIIYTVQYGNNTRLFTLKFNRHTSHISSAGYTHVASGHWTGQHDM